MRALVCPEPGRLEWSDREVPAPAPGEVLLRIARIGVCGTDLHAFKGEQPFFSYPRVLGHELAADVVELGAGVAGLELGTSVCVLPYIGCGECIACRRGRSNCCRNIEVLGVHRDGGMTEFVTVPAHHAIPSQGLDADRAALVECLAIGAHAVRRAAIETGEWALVIGVGPIGLGVAQFACDAGARVIALDIDPDRLRFFREEVRGEHGVLAGSNAAAEIDELTGGDFPTVVFDATGHAGSMSNALQYLAHGGRLVFVGLTKQRISFLHTELHKRETTLLASRNAYREDFEQVITSIADGRVNPTCMITHRAPFDALVERFPAWLERDAGVVKAVVDMDQA